MRVWRSMWHSHEREWGWKKLNVFSIQVEQNLTVNPATAANYKLTFHTCVPAPEIPAPLLSPV